MSLDRGKNTDKHAAKGRAKAYEESQKPRSTRFDDLISDIEAKKEPEPPPRNEPSPLYGVGEN